MSKRANLLKRLVASRRLGTRPIFALDRLEERQLMSAVVWTGNGLTSNWSDGNNWSSGSTPNTGDTLIFAGNSNNDRPVDDLASGFIVSDLQITGGNYVITGNSFTVTQSISVTSNALEQIFNDISIPSSFYIPLTSNSLSDLVLTGALNIGPGGTLNANGTGVVALAGSSTSPAATIEVSNGLLIAEGNFSSLFLVAPGGQLLNESITGNVTTQGIFDVPALSAEVSGDLIQEAGSTFSATYEGSGLNANLTVTGAVALAGSLDVNLLYTPAVGDVLTVINNAGSTAVDGTFDGLPEGATLNINGNGYTLSYQGGDGNDVTLTRPAVTPSVSLSVPSSSTFGDNVALTATVTGGAAPTGTANFFDGALFLGSATLDEDGSATLNMPTLDAGDHTFTAVYSGDSHNAGAVSTTQLLTVGQRQPTLNLTSTGDTSYGNSITVTGTLTDIGAGHPTGVVAFFDGSTSLGQSAVDSNGIATVTIANPPVGLNEIFAVYDGDSDYTYADSPADNVYVSTLPTTTTLTGGDPIAFSQVADFSATVTSTLGTPTGTVTFFDGATELLTADLDVNGVATLSRPWLLAGTHDITAVYNGDNTNAASASAIVTQVVTQAATTTSLAVSATTPVPNAPVTFTATVVGILNVGADPQGGRPIPTTTGTVSFYDGSTLLGSAAVTTNTSASPGGLLAAGIPRNPNGTAVFTTSTLPLGAHQITAVYNGDDNFGVSTTATATTVTVGDSIPPAVTAALTDVQSPGAAKYIFTLTFTDANGVDVLPLISNPTVSVTGPGHFAQMAKFLGVTTTAAGLRTVTFRITPPGGSWDADDAGTYTVHIAANSVKDGQGNWLAAAAAGTFYMSPTPFFDERYYLAHNPGVADAVNAGIQSSGYTHFLGWGQFEGRDPSAVYNEKRYLSLNPDVAKQVKAGMYKSGFDQLTKIGISQKRQVTAFFNEQYYLANNPDVVAAVNAGAYRSGLEQFLLVGQFQGRNPSPFFSDAYYRTQNPSVATLIQSGQFESDFEHFLESGQQQGLVASTLFNEHFYLTNYPGVAAAVTSGQFRSGLEHYILYGQAAGYRANASAKPTTH